MKYITNDEADNQINLVNMLNKGLIKHGNIQKRNRMWASSAGLCIRRNTLQNDPLVETLHDNTDSVRHMYQEIGKSYEAEIIQSFRNLGVLRFADYKLPELKNDEELNIGGKVDFIIEYQNELIGVEVKTRGSDLKIKESDIKQAQIYHLITGLPFYVLIADRNIQKYGREGLNARAVKVEMRHDERLDLVTHLILSEHLIKRGVIMPFDNNIYESKVCENCPFFNVCPKYRLNDKIETDLIYKAEQAAMKFLDLTQSRKNGITKHIYNQFNLRNK